MRNLQIVLFLIFTAVFGNFGAAQFGGQDSPIPVLQNEISGEIKARDVGDARLTSRFYTFYAENGDLNLRVETENFNGDVDLFIAQTMRPLAKISVFASDSLDVTAKTVYFRKREQVILRVEGRTLSDEAAKYKITFSGSFQAAADLPQPTENASPNVAKKTEIDEKKGGVRVNSVGTIIEVIPPKPKPTPTPKPAVAKKIPTEEIAKNAPKPKTVPRKTAPKAKPTPQETQASDNGGDGVKEVAENKETESKEERPENPPTKKPNSNVAKNKPAVKSPKPKAPPKPAPKPKEQPAETTENKEETPETSAMSKTKTSTSKVNPKPPKKQPKKPEFDPNSLAGLRLVVIMKDGKQIERPMSEVFRITIDKGELTLLLKDGKFERFNLLEVQKFSIEQ